MYTDPDLKALPASSVPAAFHRGQLYSPDMGHMPYALKGRYDYRPGNDFEPMPDGPRGDGKAWAWWNRNVAMEPVADFLGLHAGDEISLHSLQGNHETAVVTATYRHHAVVRYPMPAGAREPFASTWVNRRNADGHWY